MECKACGVWFVSGDKSGLCPTCKRTLKNMGIDIPYARLRELVEADLDGRCVVFPQVDNSSKQSFSDGLEDVFKEWSYEDKSTGLFGMSEGEKELANALISALKGESDGLG